MFEKPSSKDGGRRTPADQMLDRLRSAVQIDSASLLLLYYAGRTQQIGDAFRLPRIIRVNHIGIAVEGLTQALAVYSDALGLPVAGTDVVEGDAVHVAFLPVGESRIELLEPSGSEGPVQKFLLNRGEGVHHICLEVEDLPGLLAHLRSYGVELIDNEPRPGAHGSQVAFVHPKSANGVLIELVESQKSDC